MKRLVCSLVVLAACDNALDQRLAIVDQPRLLAIVPEPPEARPGAMIRYSLVAGGPDGPLAALPDWAYCTASKPPTEDNSVADGCLAGEVSELGSSVLLTATLPNDGCARFGPDTPSSDFRPRDPDPTGGYYQPIRVTSDALVGIGLSRITCDLPTAPGPVAHDYQTSYVANNNPTLDPIGVGDVDEGTDVELVASWPAGAAESYLFYDLVSQTLVTRRESMRLSWFATAGAIDVDASAVDEADSATSVSTTWHAPSEPGPVTLWFVLRDARGGIATQTTTITVR